MRSSMSDETMVGIATARPRFRAQSPSSRRRTVFPDPLWPKRRLARSRLPGFVSRPSRRAVSIWSRPTSWLGRLPKEGENTESLMTRVVSFPFFPKFSFLFYSSLTWHSVARESIRLKERCPRVRKRCPRVRELGRCMLRRVSASTYSWSTLPCAVSALLVQASSAPRAHHWWLSHSYHLL